MILVSRLIPNPYLIIGLKRRNMNQIEKALYLAYSYHDGQLDKGEHPYILHPIYVSMQFKSENERVVAILHDIIEDTEVTEKQLRIIGFSDAVVDAVVAITKREGEIYSDYIDRVSQNEIALRVKIEDMKHNLDVRRLANPDDIIYIKAKYDKWLPILEKRLALLDVESK